MKATEEILDTYRNQLNADYNGQYLNRSEHMLNAKFDYTRVSVEVEPLAKDTIKNVDFTGRITFTTVIPQQYGGNTYENQTLYLDFLEAKQSGCNFGSDRVEKKLLPFMDGKFESSGHFHPFYKSVSDALEETLIDDASKRGKMWWSLLKSPKQAYNPVDFGLAVLQVDKTIDLYIRYNAFEWRTELNWNDDLQKLYKQTQSKKIVKNT